MVRKSLSKKSRFKASQIVFLLSDYWHVFLALVAGVSLFILPIASLVITLVYVVYQSTEKEDEFRSVRDLVLFLVGVLLGVLVYLSFAYLLQVF